MCCGDIEPRIRTRTYTVDVILKKEVDHETENTAPWVIYYDDETVVTSEDSSWTGAPPFGVLIVVENNGGGKKAVHMGMDYYMMRDDTIMAFGDGSLPGHLLMGIPKGAMKLGRYAPKDVWQRVHDRVFPPE